MGDEPDSGANQSKKEGMKILEKPTVYNSSIIEETSDSSELCEFIRELEIETQRMISRPKQGFCKYAPKCPGRDPDCFHPYKTEGCHNYRRFEKKYER